jgi:hypothetical protein
MLLPHRVPQTRGECRTCDLRGIQRMVVHLAERSSHGSVLPRTSRRDSCRSKLSCASTLSRASVASPAPLHPGRSGAPACLCRTARSCDLLSRRPTAISKPPKRTSTSLPVAPHHFRPRLNTSSQAKLATTRWHMPQVATVALYGECGLYSGCLLNCGREGTKRAGL